MKQKRISVAIDGPAGAGKSTVAKRVARSLGLTYIDTGAMYRALTWKLLHNGQINAAGEEWAKIADETSITLDQSGLVYVDGIDVTEAIRSPDVTRRVADVARSPAVRSAMVRLQRQMAENGGMVMDGRDIGTVVLPDADVKVFLTASIESRTERRFSELKNKGHAVELNQIQKELLDRDEQDTNRAHGPLKLASDAHVLDTSHMTIDEAVSAVVSLCRERMGSEA
jgi:cytidylate kinase